MPYIEETITAGKIKEVTKYHTFRYQSTKISRSRNTNDTPEKMKKNNERNAERKLRLLLNENFKENDLYLTLTYRNNAPNADEAKNNLTKFIRKLRNKYKKAGCELKYIAVTEYQKKRIHHHLIINRIDNIGKREFENLWGYGFQKVELFGGQPDDCERLASYFIKETNNTFNTQEKVHGLRWISSKNLIHPIPEKRIIPANSWREDPKPEEGYYIDEIQRGYTEYDYPYLFYRMIKIEDYPKKE